MNTLDLTLDYGGTKQSKRFSSMDVFKSQLDVGKVIMQCYWISALVVEM